MAVDPKLFRQILSAAGAPAAAARGATPAANDAPAAQAPTTTARQARTPSLGERVLRAGRTVGRVSGGVQTATALGAGVIGGPDVSDADVFRGTTLGIASMIAPGLGIAANLATPILDAGTEAFLRGTGLIKDNALLTPEFAEEVRAAGGPEVYSRRIRNKPRDAAPEAATAAPAVAAPAAPAQTRRAAPKLGTQGDIFTNLVQFTRDFGDAAVASSQEGRTLKRGQAEQALQIESAKAIAALLAASGRQGAQPKIVEGLTPEESLVVDPATAIARRLRFSAQAVRGDDGKIYVIEPNGTRRPATAAEAQRLGVK